MQTKAVFTKKPGITVATEVKMGIRFVPPNLNNQNPSKLMLLPTPPTKTKFNPFDLKPAW